MNSFSSKTQSRKKSSLVADPINDPLESLMVLGDFNDIFTGDNLEQTAFHIKEQAEESLYLLSDDEQEIINNLVATFKEEALQKGEQPSYTVTDEDGNSLTITKATDILSTNYKESYNHAIVKVGGLEIDWYFVLEDGGEKTAGENYHNKVDPTSTKSQILYEYSESNKATFNNTGYKFYRSDGKPLENTKVTQFIAKMKKNGDPRFIRDFPFHVSGTTAHPTYEVVGSKYKYYEYNFDLDPLKDGDNLKSKLLSGNIELEATHDDALTLYKVSSGGEDIRLLRQGINQYFSETKIVVQMPDGTGYDEQLIQRVKKFQELEGLPVDGKMGKTTIDKLDEWLSKRDKKKTTTTNTPTSKKGKYDASKDKFSLTTLGKETSNLITAIKEKDKKELIYSMAEILYQLKLLYNEDNDENPSKKGIQIGAAQLLLVPLKMAADAWVPDNPAELGWYDLMMMWFFELGKSPLIIDNKEAVTIRDLRAHEGVMKVRNDAQKLIDTEKEIGEEEYEVEFSSPWNYRLANMEKNLKEMKSLDPGKVDSLELFMGTYLAKVKVVKKKGENAKMYFEVNNESHWESATRFRREKDEGGGQEGIIYDVPRGTGVGLGGDLKVTFKWEE